jgi:hypothetical protein
MRSIEIDFDVHKRIEAERRDFSDTDNAVLRRLLGLEEPLNGSSPPPPICVSRIGAWSSDGVVLAPGARLRMTYNGRRHEGVIEDGVWLVEGRRFSSPSGAARGVALTKRGKHPHLDGWNYWEVKPPEAAGWISLAQLRFEATKR